MDPHFRSRTISVSVLDLAPHVQPASALEPDEEDVFPPGLSVVSRCRLAELCDDLFLQLDTDMPDLRAVERYEAIRDELMLREISSGVA